MAARAKKKLLAKRFADAISEHCRDLEHAYVNWIWLRGSASYVIIGTLRNRTAGRLRTAEWRIKMSRKTGNAQSRATFFRHSAVLSLPAVLLRKVPINYLITESKVVTGKSQTEALPYWPSDSEVNTVGRGLRFSRNDRTVEVIKLFIIWLRKRF